ncbi:helix-turn-helix domain-containing protein [Streptomyces sp. RKAG337]|uniref:helix-turn-helix domain-containing protein n=1 Tax=Streptomyces sp. RKAG337 TaxID=2893404 RepID=UPI002033E1EF|nr:helix-turn-helix domain-containing protein [Streptomyces sp. RKAG337]MCM2425123.1 helix-turn-helix domain-containing protein [Streptomyces sp. RKAG337]
MNQSAEQHRDDPWDQMAVPVPVAASLLGVSSDAIQRLIDTGHLQSCLQGQHRFVPLVSVFAYRNQHPLPGRPATYSQAVDDQAALDRAADRLAG